MGEEKNLWILEYSPSQNWLHIALLTESVRKNFMNYMGNGMSDWICMGIFDEYDDAAFFSRYIQLLKAKYIEKINVPDDDFKYIRNYFFRHDSFKYFNYQSNTLMTDKKLSDKL